MVNAPNRIRVNMALAGLGAGLMGPLAAPAQEAFPNRTINLVVPYPPGGGTDIVGRFIAEALGEVLPQKAIVVNKGGANGIVGAQHVKSERPDGHTLMFTSQTIVAQTYEPAPKISHKDFTLIGILNQDAFGLAVAANSKWKTMQDLIADARANPGKVSVGITTPIPISILERATGVKFNHIPYAGSAGFQTALLANTVAAATVVVGDATQLLLGDKLRLVGVMSPQRVERFPNVPTFREAGANADFIFWRGLFVHKDTPPAIVATLRQAVAKIGASQSFRDRLTKANFIPANMVGEAELNSFLAKEEVQVEAVMKQLFPR